MDLHASLTDHRRYQHQIEQLHKKYLFTPQLYTLEHDGVSLASLVMHASTVAKLIARAVADGQYHFEPARVRTIRVKGKDRQVFSYRLMDLIVHNTIAHLIQEAMTPFLSPRLYSYRAGVSWLAPASDFAAYIRAYRRRTLDPRQRGIYVLRRDIDAYTDNMPVGQQSPVWGMLEAVLRSSGFTSSSSPRDWSLIEQVVRPEICGPDGGRFCLIRGIPTGQRITAALYNLYLSPLDHELDQIPGSFYARYSDDLLFAHPDAGVAREVDRRINEVLSGLGLRVKPTKSRNFYLTAANRRSVQWEQAGATTAITFVGLHVLADGTVALDHRKARGLLRDLKQRAIRTANTLQGRDQEHIGRVVCSVINGALEPGATPFQHASAPLLRRAVTNRGQLAQLDYSVARIVLRAVTGQTGVHAFRKVPYRKMRDDWGLISLVHARNTWGRR